ncbi:unnamed protein product, partial [Musa banksii]
MLFLSPSHWCVHVRREGAESTTGSLHFTSTEERRMVGEDGTCHQRWDKTSLGFPFCRLLICLPLGKQSPTTRRGSSGSSRRRRAT